MRDHQRFLSKVKKRKSGCWEWIGCLTNGYGSFYYKRNVRAHRYSYEYYKEPIPEELTIDHLCMNRKCVNPDHLEAVTMRVNILRSNGESAQNARKTHCIHGHILSGTNLVVGNNKYGKYRACVICKRRQATKSQTRIRAAYTKIRIRDKIGWKKCIRCLIVDVPPGRPIYCGAYKRKEGCSYLVRLKTRTSSERV